MLYGVAANNDQETYEAINNHPNVWRIAHVEPDEGYAIYDVHAPLGADQDLSEIPGVISVLPIRYDVIIDFSIPDGEQDKILNAPEEKWYEWGLLDASLDSIIDGRAHIKAAFDSVKFKNKVFQNDLNGDSNANP